eukprot:364203-Chlamydomonas_euryale.AAC.6
MVALPVGTRLATWRYDWQSTAQPHPGVAALQPRFAGCFIVQFGAHSRLFLDASRSWMGEVQLRHQPHVIMWSPHTCEHDEEGRRPGGS